MKFLLALSLVMFGCQNEAAETKAGDFGSDEAKVKTDELTWHYAKYKFIKAGYKDVYAAVRVGFNKDSDPQAVLELKDLHPDRVDREVEKAELSKVEDDSNDTTYAFTGDSVLRDKEDNTKEYGGIYTGKLALKEDGTVADDGCCGEMTFNPAAVNDKDFIVIGRKQDPAAGETFDAAWWAEVTGASDEAQYFYGNYKFSHDATSTNDDFTVALKLEVDKDGKATRLWIKKGEEDVKEIALTESNNSFSGDGYTLQLEKDDDGKVTGINNAELKYSDGTNNFTGTAGDDLSKEGWGAIIGTCKLSMSKWMDNDDSVINEVEGKQSLPRGTQLTFTVTLKCDDNIVKEGDNASLKVTLAKRDGADSDYENYPDDANYAQKSLDKGVATYHFNYGSGGQNKAYLQFKATVSIDGNDISVEGKAFTVPAS